MHQNASEKMAAYIVAINVLFGSLVGAATATLNNIPDTLGHWASVPRQTAQPQATHISVVVANAREIRAALAKPIPGPDPLPPITAKLAFGHLKPGGKGGIAQHHLKLPKKALDAMAMDTNLNHFKASSAAAPDLHRVY
jgi:hypothetical protein